LKKQINMNSSSILTVNTEILEEVAKIETLCIKNNLLIPIPYIEINKFSQNAISLFCFKNAIYQFPTTELIDFLKNEIGNNSAIEIGSGNGSIGRALNIPRTDNRMQEWDKIKSYYNLMRQPTIIYPDDIEKIDGLKAIKKYNPHTVIAAWITQKWEEGMIDGNMHGVDETEMLCMGIKKYIHIGNNVVHLNKKILQKRKKRQLKFPWLVSKSLNSTENVIYIFDL